MTLGLSEWRPARAPRCRTSLWLANNDTPGYWLASHLQRRQPPAHTPGRMPGASRCGRRARHGVCNRLASKRQLLPTLILKKVKASSYVAQCPVLRTVQSALHVTSLADLFTQTPSRLLCEASSHMLQLMCEGCSYTYAPLSARYSFIQLSELEQRRVKKRAQGFKITAQDSNPSSRSRES